jgi:hypothetical protein
VEWYLSAMGDEPIGERAPAPPSVVAPPSILGSRTTRAAFVLVLASLLILAAAFLFVLLRAPPELPGSKPPNPAAAPS